ncbi:MAG: histidinol phosphatase, partial [Flammeovirgaceae bacterium]|nr:histidinol phosphatase [Flammeovirgaceae bacterium]
CRYFQLMREMIITSSPDIVGHLDKIKIQNSNNKFFSEEASWYRDEIIKTIGVIKDAGVIVEVNTRGLYLGKSSTTYPSPWILETLCQKGIPITINSDAHHPGDLINKFRTTATMLKEIGFKKIMVLREGKWKGFNYNADGIKIS